MGGGDALGERLFGVALILFGVEFGRGSGNQNRGLAVGKGRVRARLNALVARVCDVPDVFLRRLSWRWPPEVRVHLRDLMGDLC